MSDSVRPHRRQPTRLPCPCDSPGKNTGVGCHFLLQCMKVKSESEVAQSCPTLNDPMDYSPPGSSIHGIFQARVLEWGAIASSEQNAESIRTTVANMCSSPMKTSPGPHPQVLIIIRVQTPEKYNILIIVTRAISNCTQCINHQVLDPMQT